MAPFNTGLHQTTVVTCRHGLYNKLASILASETSVPDVIEYYTKPKHKHTVLQRRDLGLTTFNLYMYSETALCTYVQGCEVWKNPEPWFNSETEENY